MRTIDADALSAFVDDLRSALHKEQSKFKGMTDIEFDTRDYMLLNFQYAIDNAPTVERPTGEWETPFEVYGKTYHKCTHCHISSELILINNYCPNCGADMTKEAENECKNNT